MNGTVFVDDAYGTTRECLKILESEAPVSPSHIDALINGATVRLDLLRGLSKRTLAIILPGDSQVIKITDGFPAFIKAVRTAHALSLGMCGDTLFCVMFKRLTTVLEVIDQILAQADRTERDERAEHAERAQMDAEEQLMIKLENAERLQERQSVERAQMLADEKWKFKQQYSELLVDLVQRVELKQEYAELKLMDADEQRMRAVQLQTVKAMCAELEPDAAQLVSDADLRSESDGGVPPCELTMSDGMSLAALTDSKSDVVAPRELLESGGNTLVVFTKSESAFDDAPCEPNVPDRNDGIAISESDHAEQLHIELQRGEVPKFTTLN